MEGQKSFKERVKETLISYAQDYKMYYIVSAHEDNYLHLTGVHTNLGALATSNTNVTLEFMVVGKAKPMTLLKGNELDSEKAQSLDLVLRKTRGECNFKEMVVGSNEILREYKEKLGSLVAESLYNEE